jgi:hypothetical protein
VPSDTKTRLLRIFWEVDRCEFFGARNFFGPEFFGGGRPETRLLRIFGGRTLRKLAGAGRSGGRDAVSPVRSQSGSGEHRNFPFPNRGLPVRLVGDRTAGEPVKTLTRLDRAAKRAADAIAERDRLIEQARGEGHTLRAVADAAGVSHQTVVNIIARNVVARDTVDV